MVCIVFNSSLYKLFCCWNLSIVLFLSDIWSIKALSSAERSSLTSQTRLYSDFKSTKQFYITIFQFIYFGKKKIYYVKLTLICNKLLNYCKRCCKRFVKFVACEATHISFHYFHSNTTDCVTVLRRFNHNVKWVPLPICCILHTVMFRVSSSELILNFF